jgi:energy-converting hydrogenase B subunit Q
MSEEISKERIGIVIVARSGLGVLHELTGVIARHRGNIASVEIIEERPPESRIYFEIDLPVEPSVLQSDLKKLEIVREVTVVKTLQKIYGKRIIIVGGGAQVGQVAIGAISEADRHNIRGEHISVDTIPLVGEQPLADAVRAVARLPRARALVLAGALMGGEIEKAVREVRAQGLLVISLNMAGSVPEAADLVVTDPVQAGVMAVMAVADTAKFTIERLSRRIF